MKLLIVGAGQYGQVVRETAQACGLFESIAFLDDNSPLAVGPIESHSSLFGKYDAAFVALGNATLRRTLMDNLSADGYTLVSLVSPASYVSPSAVLGDGCIVEAGAVVNTAAVLGDGVFVCAGATVNHNAVIGSCCQIDCGAVIGARAEVPENTKIECSSFFGEQSK